MASSFIRETSTVFPAHHLVTITLADQAAPDKGTQDALANLRLHLGNGGDISFKFASKT